MGSFLSSHPRATARPTQASGELRPEGQARVAERDSSFGEDGYRGNRSPSQTPGRPSAPSARPVSSDETRLPSPVLQAVSVRLGVPGQRSGRVLPPRPRPRAGGRVPAVSPLLSVIRKLPWVWAHPLQGELGSHPALSITTSSGLREGEVHATRAQLFRRREPGPARGLGILCGASRTRSYRDRDTGGRGGGRVRPGRRPLGSCGLHVLSTDASTGTGKPKGQPSGRRRAFAPQGGTAACP